MNTLPETTENALLLLHAAVDQLATQAMLGDGPVHAAGDLSRALISLGEVAKNAGLAAVGTMAEELALSLAGPQTDNSTTFLTGIAMLQSAIEEASRGDSVAPEPNDAGTQARGPRETLGEATDWSADPELLSDFFMESGDHLTSIESELLKLEQDAGNKDAIHSVFRSFHTIKGLAGFMGFPGIQQVAHEVETLLDSVRQGRLTVTPGIIDVVLASADHLKGEMERVQSMAAGGSGGPPADGGPLLEAVRRARTGIAPGNSGTGKVPSPSPEAPNREAQEPSGPEFVASAEVAPAEVAPAEVKKSVALESHVVKVDTAKLDFLVDMAGELAIAQSMIQHDGHLHAAGNPRLQRNLSHLARITEEVQKTTMSMRMVPIGQLFQKSVRLVRDLTRKSGKQSGARSQRRRYRARPHHRGAAFRSADAYDPQRRGSRRGIARGARGGGQESDGLDPPQGLSSAPGRIVVEVGDDGRGLDRQKILKKAAERGLVQDGAALSDKEVFNLIFEPGFSTAEIVTDVSGRGVGMDVVRKQMQKLRGRIDIESAAGPGIHVLPEASA